MAQTNPQTSPQQRPHLLIGIMADETTVLGFLLAGIGEVSNNRKNFKIVEPNTPKEELEKMFEELLAFPNLGVVLVGIDVKKMIPQSVNRRGSKLPIILEIPTKTSLAEAAAKQHHK